MYKVYDSASQTKCKSLISRSWNLPLNFVSVPCLLNCFETQVRPGPGGGVQILSLDLTQWKGADSVLLDIPYAY